MPRRSVNWLGWLAAVLTLASGWQLGAQEAAPATAYEEHLLLPVRIHLLRAEQVPEVHGKMAPEEARRILSRVNTIWAQAGVQFWAESIRVEEAANQGLWKSMAGQRTEAHLLLLRPKETLAESMFHVYYVRDAMRPNGVALGRDGVFVKETAALRRVPGGLDTFVPRVTAHELGHILGLDHRQDTFNLLASGTTGYVLNGEEAAGARRAASQWDWRRTPQQALEQAEADLAAGRKEAAQDLLWTLAEAPGSSPVKLTARATLARIDDP